MRIKLHIIFFLVLLGCTTSEETRVEVPLTTLVLYETVVSLDDEILSRQNEIFVVFNAIGEIAKYEVTTGQKLWSRSTPMTNEIDTLTQHYFGAMNALLKLTDGVSIHRKYLGGFSGPNGELYLTAYNFTDKQLWIHKFNGFGVMEMRYRMDSEVHLLPIADIDFENQRVFVLTEDSEIRTYAF